MGATAAAPLSTPEELIVPRLDHKHIFIRKMDNIMNKNANDIETPAWLTLASGTMKAIQHRQTRPCAPQKMERDAFDPPYDDPLSDLLGAPDPLPPMVDLAEEWITMNEADDRAFCVRRPDPFGKTLQILATLRLCATLTDIQTAMALSDPAAITLLDVGHPDWLQPTSRAVQDVLPDTLLSYSTDLARTADLLILAPQSDDNLAIPKDAMRFAKTISEGLECEVPILIITAGHRGLPDKIANILPPARRLVPLGRHAARDERGLRRRHRRSPLCALHRRD